MLPKTPEKKSGVFFSQFFLGEPKRFFCEVNLKFFLEIFISWVFFSVLYLWGVSRFSVYRISWAFLSTKKLDIFHHYACSATMNTIDIEEENRCLQLSTENKVAYLPLHMCGSYAFLFWSLHYVFRKHWINWNYLSGNTRIHSISDIFFFISFSVLRYRSY